MYRMKDLMKMLYLVAISKKCRYCRTRADAKENIYFSFWHLVQLCIQLCTIL